MAVKTIYVKFFKTPNGIEYKSLFKNGVAPDLNSALNQLTDTKEIMHDLYYYYDDVEDVEIGSFEPINGKKLIGRIPVKLHLSKDDVYKNSPHAVQYLLKNKADIEKQQEYINRLKNSKEETGNLINRLRSLIGGWKHES